MLWEMIGRWSERHGEIKEKYFVVFHQIITDIIEALLKRHGIKAALESTEPSSQIVSFAIYIQEGDFKSGSSYSTDTN